jgi:hypothetical protein
MTQDDYQAGFYVHHFVKDLGIALAVAERMQLKLPGLALAKRLYEQLAEQGHAHDGTQAHASAVAIGLSANTDPVPRSARPPHADRAGAAATAVN